MLTTSPLYTAPGDFVSRLGSVFNQRLRLRWSLHRKAWIIEQRVGRAALPPLRIDPHRDDLLQARDGYAPVLVTQPGSRMACEFCGGTLRVPVRSIEEVPCAPCLARGRDARVICTYWPLDETLIDYLRLIDPELHGGRELKDRIMGELARNEALTARVERDAAAQREAAGRYYFPHMFQIPSVGWTPGGTPHRLPNRGI